MKCWADIGDNQSIQEKSEHIFSSYQPAYAKWWTELLRDLWCLLDELGRATDPEEGGALGIAILEQFHSQGAFTLAIKHTCWP